MNHSAVARRAGIVVLSLLLGGTFLRAQDVTQAQWNQLLFTAAAAGKSEALADILDHRYAAVDAEDADGWTALFHAATAEGDPGGSVALLLQRGAAADHVNKKGNSALMLAALKGNIACVRALLAGGANRALANPAGLTAAALARKQGRDAIAGLLLSEAESPPAAASAAAAPPPARSGQALLQACADEKLAEVGTLLGAGADPDQAGAQGMTCLMIAAFKGNSQLAKLLLRAGANPALRLDGRATAAELAEKQHHAETAALIRGW
jgi:ankyrin repeat protein